MKRIHLIHWNDEEARERAARVAALGYIVERAPFTGPSSVKALAAKPPAAVVISLERLPSHGREVAVALRTTKGTRALPIVFVAGEAEKVARVRALLPDAIYTSWRGVKGALARALAQAPAAVVVPSSRMAAYAGVPLAKKLGIKAGSLVALAAAPKDFEKKLAPLPEGARVTRRPPASADILLWFVASPRELAAKVAAMGARATYLWICWPKKGSANKGYLTQNEVRRVGLAAGLVDFKIASLDETWSGLCFRMRARSGA